MMRTGAAGRGRLVGQPMRRTEDRRFLTGAACYVGDFERARMCHAVLVRSPLPHARLRAVRSDAARARPGVLAVLTARDLGDAAAPIPIRLAPLPGFDRYLQPVLAARPRAVRGRARGAGDRRGPLRRRGRGGAGHGGLRAARPRGRRARGDDRSCRAPRGGGHEHRLALYGLARRSRGRLRRPPPTRARRSSAAIVMARCRSRRAGS